MGSIVKEIWNDTNDKWVKRVEIAIPFLILLVLTVFVFYGWERDYMVNRKISLELKNIIKDKKMKR